MAGELLVRVLKFSVYEKALSVGPITNDMEITLFQDANNWNLSEFYGPGWVLLDNRDFSEAAWGVISSTYELPLLEGFVCEEACPTLVTEEALEIWYKRLTTVLMQPNINPVVLEIAKALYGLVQLVKHDHGLRLTVQGLL